MKINSLDIKDHSSISAVIKDENGRILVQKHAKHGFITIPMGKIENGMTVEETLIEELNSECGIIPVKYGILVNKELIYTLYKKKWTDLKKDVLVKVDHYVFLIEEYDGVIENRETDKHLEQYFISLEDLKNVEHISQPTQLVLQLNGIIRDCNLKKSKISMGHTYHH